MAESKLQQSVGDSDKCPICLETCQELKTLNCQHSFCLHCLQDWMKKKGALECPNCRQMHLIPEGGLQELPSNAIEVETVEHLDKDHDTSCCFCKCNADFYCQDCSQYLCTSCTKSHDLFPALKNHKLQPINTNWPKAREGPEPLHQPMCPLHEKELEFYCNICRTPICQKCTVTDHSEDEGQHEPIRASDAFNDFKVTANDLMVQAVVHKQQVQVGITKCIINASKLSKSRICLRKDINNSVEEIIKLVREAGKALEGKLDDICEAKKEKSDSQMDELKSIMSDVEEKQDCIAKLLKSDEATALQTCQQAIIELQERIAVLPETEPRDDGKVYFSPEKDHILSTLKKHGIGSVSEKPNANIFEIISEYPKVVTRCQPFHVKIVQHFKCEIDEKDLQANLWDSTGNVMKNAKVEQIAEGKYVVKKPSNNNNVSYLYLNVTFCNASIKGSPIKILLEYEGSTRTIDNFLQSAGIQSYIGINNLFMSQNGYILVSCDTNEIFKFNHTGAYVSKIKSSQLRGICELKNNNLIFCGNSSIRVCKQDGKVIKSIPTGLGTQNFPSGIDVNEALNLVYVADQTANCVHAFNMESNLKVKTIGTKGGLEGQMNGPSSVAVTKEGNIIVADTNRIQLFDHEGQFIKLLIGGGNTDGMVIKPSRVVVDNDDNVIVASFKKVQLFDRQGKFIRVIHRSPEPCTNAPKPCEHYVISLASQYPRRLALAELNSKQIRVINY